VESTCALYRPEIVFHAAAYKHVPMMEKNPTEAIRTNVMGTRNVAEACTRANVKKFVLISTDKAVNPTNVMGTTKRVAEILCEDLWSKGTSTQFIIVRFGNVVGSNGSAIPLFKKQIERGGPITVTHPDITRYFMSIPEASQLVLQAATMGTGGEIFVLDMGEPIKIIDLVDRMLGLAGLERDKDIKVEFTGLRPGEKLYEELFQEGEKFTRTNHDKIFKARNRAVDALFARNLESLLQLARTYDGEDTVKSLQDIVPEYVRFN
jgi:FlaA1/EpsC-like NDP-sugar epimerase